MSMKMRLKVMFHMGMYDLTSESTPMVLIEDKVASHAFHHSLPFCNWTLARSRHDKGSIVVLQL